LIDQKNETQKKSPGYPRSGGRLAPARNESKLARGAGSDNDSFLSRRRFTA